MKVLVVVLGIITATLQSRVAAVTVTISAYNATGELDIRRDPFTLGTRVLLTCDVTGLLEGSEPLSYKWYHNCTGRPNRLCEIQDRDLYYRVVKDTLLVDVTSLDQGGRYYCNADSLPVRKAAITRQVAVAGNAAPFLYTPTSLLPEHSVLTDVQLTTGRNGQQWITCRSGGEGTRPEIWMGSERVVNSSTTNSATIGLGTQHPNGLYHCLSGQSQREYFSLFSSTSVTLPTPIVQNNSTVWTLTSPDGSQVERYIVEFECRVRSITFVEKYMSVSASEGTGRVATSVSCFGGLGQLYRVKVWAVSGANISPALDCTPDEQCSEEEGGVVDNRGTFDTLPPTPSEPQGEKLSIGLGIGLSLLFLLALSTLVVIIVVVLAVRVKRKAACKQKRDITRRNESYYPAVVKREMEMKEKSVEVDYDYVGYKVTDDVNPHMAADMEVHISTRRPAPNVPSSLASATSTPAGSERADVRCNTAINVHYSVPTKKMGKMATKHDGLIGNGSVVKGEYDDIIEPRYKTEAADSECWQLNEAGYKVWKFSL